MAPQLGFLTLVLGSTQSASTRLSAFFLLTKFEYTQYFSVFACKAQYEYICVCIFVIVVSDTQLLGQSDGSIMLNFD